MKDSDSRSFLLKKSFWLLMIEGFFPLLIAYAMFYVSDEGINIYKKLFKQIKGESVIPPLGISGWFLVITIPLSGVVSIWLTIIRHREKEESPNIETLKKKLNFYSDNINTLADGLLYSFATELNLGNADRVTIYASLKTSAGGDEFVPIARYAGNPSYRTKGRTSHPSNEGIISRAWHDGSCFDNKVPNPEKKQEYVNYHLQNYRITDTICAAMKMKSRLYYGWRVRDSSGKNPIAVIIIESTNNSRFKKEELDSFFENKDRFLREFVTNIRPLLPSASGSLLGF